MRTHRKIQIFLAGMVVMGTVIGWSLHQTQAAPSHPLEQLVPGGALLYIEARDFSALIRDWTESPEKAEWLKSDDYRVFSNSRLFLRLKKASDEFASAAGIPPSTQFLNDVAGRESALAIYNIGNLEFLYITRLSSGNFLQSALWQSRNKFEPRNSTGKPFFTRKDRESGRVVAFGVADDYLVLGTREDLVATSLELLSGGKARAVQDDGWYTRASAATRNPAGDLRMLLNLEKIASTPHFRTYWVQQNITEMQSYSVAVTDLYRDGAVYREERVILAKKPLDDENALRQVANSVSDLVALVPKGEGFYRAAPVTTKESLAALQQKILAPHFGAGPAQKLAPDVQLTGGQTGSASDLETRIDQQPAVNSVNTDSMESLHKQFAAATPQAMLVVHSARKNQDNVLLNIASLVAISASSEWDLAAVQSGIQQVVAPGLTAGQLGTEWREVKGAGGYYELDGLSPVLLARRGKVLLLANDATMLKSVLQLSGSTPVSPVSYAAGFNHSGERKNFYQLTALTDKGTASGQEPQFFSQNVSSLSRTFGRLESEEVVMRHGKDKIEQTVSYHWAK
jgi:hypothetical protein